ncbi:MULTISPECIES: ABC transporter substrate-binding protein [unclassified Paludibacterium]|uniref:substrate-binding periplasmic protein n=1 Tax=unclassified Paludibacterium TaxID=2618429 RepID=UPI001C0436DB|nr:ABC transporter substrate-binding protein [Paludibacterium sp. B53371]BEV72676.1 hypothetical protein THUN1379_21580 [Paludibacterium sp. THUN1379]
MAASCLPLAAQSTLVVRYGPVSPINEYRWRVLDLALSHTRATDGPYRLQPYEGPPVSQSRAITLLERAQLDVVAIPCSPVREKILRPVRFDILRGMLGYRILMVRAEEQTRFARLSDRQLRQQILLGFNSQWADYPILIANGFRVTPTVGYEELFAMLAAGRFDALPRGLNEIGPELEMFRAKYPGLVAEPGLALFFPLPVYFWVNQSNAALAERIGRGLNAALADGSLKALFQQYHQQEIARLRREHRRVILLTNPQLPAGTPPTDTSWWWPH